MSESEKVDLSWDNYAYVAHLQRENEEDQHKFDETQ